MLVLRAVSLRRALAALLGLVLTVSLASVAQASAASAASRCPVPDKASNVVILRVDQESATLPGSRSADYCAGGPAYARTQFWNSDGAKRQDVAGVGTWIVRAGGRLTFTPTAAFRARPEGKRGPGHDAITKIAVYDDQGHAEPLILVAFVVWPATAFPDSIATCTGKQTVAALSNDVAGWRGTTSANKRQAKLRPGTLRLVGSKGEASTVDTELGRWRVTADSQVKFIPTVGWHGTTPPMRYTVKDTFDNSLTSTITATTCAKGASDGTDAEAGTDVATDRAASQLITPTAVTSSTPTSSSATYTWLPLGLAAVCLLVGTLVLRRWRTGGGSGPTGP